MATTGRLRLSIWSVIAAITLISSSSAFSPVHLSRGTSRIHRKTFLEAQHEDTTNAHIHAISDALRTFTATATALTILSLPIDTPLVSSAARADEWGRETEAPTLFTGETVMICKKRGPLGACIETAVRTAQNDNDKSLEYFKDPSEEVKKRQAISIRGAAEENEANELIQKLKKKSEENRERNENEVRVKTLMNDQVRISLYYLHVFIDLPSDNAFYFSLNIE